MTSQHEPHPMMTILASKGGMKAVCWYGTNRVEVETVPDPVILNPHDAVIKITSTAICGSDLHLYDGYIRRQLLGGERPRHIRFITG